MGTFAKRGLAVAPVDEGGALEENDDGRHIVAPDPTALGVGCHALVCQLLRRNRGVGFEFYGLGFGV